MTIWFIALTCITYSNFLSKMIVKGILDFFSFIFPNFYLFRDLRDVGCYVKVIDGCQQLDKKTKYFIYYFVVLLFAWSLLDRFKLTDLLIKKDLFRWIWANLIVHHHFRHQKMSFYTKTMIELSIIFTEAIIVTFFLISVSSSDISEFVFFSELLDYHQNTRRVSCFLLILPWFPHLKKVMIRLNIFKS